MPGEAQHQNLSSLSPLAVLPRRRSSCVAPSPRLTLLVLGAGSVGKTALIHQLLFSHFPRIHQETVDDVYCAEYEVEGSRDRLMLDVLDTAGTLSFPAMREVYIAKANAFILVYSITDESSWQEVCRLRELILARRSLTSDQVPPIVVVGNKLDLDKPGGLHPREVDAAFAELSVCLEWEHGFVECSAKNGFHVDAVLRELLRQAHLVRDDKSCPQLRQRCYSVPTRQMPPDDVVREHMRREMLRRKSLGNTCIIS